MEILGMKADMLQCNYLPGYYSTMDLNLNASCSIWPFANIDSVSKNGCCSNGNMTSSPLDQNLGYKEIVKQTMLLHEATFKDQIHELHRLYNRQKELMAEMKRNKSHSHHLWLETLPSNPYLFQISSEYSKKTFQVSALPWQNNACNQSSGSGTENKILYWDYVQGKTVQPGCDPAQTEGYIKESGLFEYKCKKVGKKILDLELPADEYIDSEDDESLAGDKVQSPNIPNCSLKRISEDIQKSDTEPSLDRGDHNFIPQKHYMMGDSCSRKFNDLADLSEPINLHEETDQEMVCGITEVPGARKFNCKDFHGKINTDILVQSNEIVQSTVGVPGACLIKDEARQSNSEFNSMPEGMLVETLSSSSKGIEIKPAGETLTSNLMDWSSGKLKSKRKLGFESLENDFSTNHVSSEQYAAACKHTSNQLVSLADVINYESTLSTPSAQSFADVKTTRDIDLNSLSPGCFLVTVAQSPWMEVEGKSVGGCNSMPDARKKLTANEVVVENKCDKKFSGFGFLVDLNSCINEDESSPLPTLSDFEASASPGNKERSPRRVESVKNQLETSSSGKGSKEMLEELAKIAVESIVSISSSEVQIFVENAASKPSEALKIQSLNWFARTASSVVDDPESQFGVALSYKDIDVDDEYLFDGIDYFEAMTLKLKEMEVEEYCNIQKEDTSGQKEKAMCSPSPPSQPRRGRTRRGKQQQKDFQSEILQCLASLSRYEVTEDLQAIGLLIETSQNQWNSGTRKASRNGSTKGRRRRRPSHMSSSNMQTAMCTRSKHENKGNNLNIVDISLIG